MSSATWIVSFIALVILNITEARVCSYGGGCLGGLDRLPRTSDTKPAPVTVPAPVPVTVPAPVPAAVPAPVTVTVPVPVPVAVPVPVPVPVAVPVAVPVPVPVPVNVPVPVPNPFPVRVPITQPPVASEMPVAQINNDIDSEEIRSTLILVLAGRK